MSETYAIPPASTVKLPDGRLLAWYEFGDSAGRPCLYMPGTPQSGLAGLKFDDVARDHRVRLICPDRPALGRSDFQPGRPLSAWASDIAALADHLGVDRFTVLGESGDGPHVLAVAHGLPDRVTAAILVASAGPIAKPWYRRERLLTSASRPMFCSPFTRSPAPPDDEPDDGPLSHGTGPGEVAAGHAAQHQAKLPGRGAPHRPAPPGRELRGGHGGRSARRAWQRRRAPCPREPMGIFPGGRAHPVHLWHGTGDRNVPVAVGHALATRLPNCVSHFVDGAGHTIATRCAPEIIATSASASA